MGVGLSRLTATFCILGALNQLIEVQIYDKSVSKSRGKPEWPRT